jgi:hypothetical protein
MSLIYYTHNLTKGEYMTTINMNKFLETFNQVDSKLYEISKILKTYDSSLNVEDLMNQVYESLQDNVYNQQKSLSFKNNQKIKDDSIVS